MTNGAWTASWSSSFDHVEAGFSTFLNNCVEAAWFVEDVMFGESNKDTTDLLFQHVREQVNTWIHDAHFHAMQYLPDERVPNQLLRGRVWETNNCLYEAGFPRMNVQFMEAIFRKGTPFMHEFDAPCQFLRSAHCAEAIAC